MKWGDNMNKKIIFALLIFVIASSVVYAAQASQMEVKSPDKLKNGERIFSKDHNKRKSRVILFQTLVTYVLNKDPSTPLKDIKKAIAQSEKMRIDRIVMEKN